MEMHWELEISLSLLPHLKKKKKIERKKSSRKYKYSTTHIEEYGEANANNYFVLAYSFIKKKVKVSSEESSV